MDISPPGWTIQRHGAVASTNLIANDLAGTGAAEGTVVVAEEQVAGKGRADRVWTSPPGNLYCSVIIRPGPDFPRIADLSFVVAVAMRSAVATLVSPTAVHLKWPNDILIDGKKASGILLEGGSDFVVAGTGVNVATVPNGAENAVVLQEFNGVLTVDEVLCAYMSALADRLNVWRAHGFGPIRREWLDHCKGQGLPIIARTGRSIERGIFEDLDETGALILRGESGERSIIHAADIFFAEEGV